MILVISRVFRASLDADGEHVCDIGKGLLVYGGISENDTEENICKAADKVANLRIFPNDEGKMFHRVKDIGGEVLAVSNFTLCANVKSRRPDFTHAAKPERAKPLFDLFVKKLSESVETKCGVFGAHMEVETRHDGPVNIVMDV
jgi:D-tyrosyl-tRNA(Tyr) deacylase